MYQSYFGRDGDVYPPVNRSDYQPRLGPVPFGLISYPRIYPTNYFGNDVRPPNARAGRMFRMAELEDELQRCSLRAAAIRYCPDPSYAIW